MSENTEAELEAVRRLVSKQPDAHNLAQILGLDPTQQTVPMCREHGKPKTRRGDGQGWRCRNCDESHRTRKATPGRPKG